VKAFREQASCCSEPSGTTFRSKTVCQRELVAEAKFVFISMSPFADLNHKPYLLPYANHGLTIPTE
jgi:hypothetical protein